MIAKFDVVDKTGRTMRMTALNWHHISKRHPEIVHNQKKIVETLQKPDTITGSLNDEQVKYYYKYYKNLVSPYKFVRVIGKYLNGEGL